MEFGSEERKKERDEIFILHRKEKKRKKLR